jgi:hypothetical protein
MYLRIWGEVLRKIIWSANRYIFGSFANLKTILSANLWICDLRNLFADCLPLLLCKCSKLSYQLLRVSNLSRLCLSVEIVYYYGL